MIEKIWEDIYGRLRKRWWGAPLIVFALISVVLFSVWNSLPDSVKEKILTSQATRQTNPQESIKQPDTANIDIPDLGKAARVIQATTSDMLVVERAKITDVSPKGFEGYFRLQIQKSGHIFSYANVLINSDISPNLYVTARLSSGPGVSTLEIRGLDVWFLLDAHRNQYMIYNSEDNQTYWKDLPVKKDNYWNTLGIHQVGRVINVFLNSTYIDSFKLWNMPRPGKVGLYFKAEPTGGQTEFQRLAVYEFTSQ